MTHCSTLLEAAHVAPDQQPDLDHLLTPRDGAGHQAVRLELICRIRKLIDSGQYDTDERLHRALDTLLDSMM